jgi:hypothetical protein
MGGGRHIGKAQSWPDNCCDHLVGCKIGVGDNKEKGKFTPGLIFKKYDRNFVPSFEAEEREEGN